MDSVPMVAITGQVPRASIGTDAFQETDIFGITLPIVKHSWVVRDPADIGRIVAEAFLIAATGRPGPVLIDVPKDVGVEEFDYVPVEPGSVKPAGYQLPPAPRPEAIRAALDLIRQARRPLLYVGGGAISSGAHAAVHQLAERFRLPVTTTLMGKGAFDETHPLAVGMLGMHGTAYANFAVTECDLLIAVGARFDDRVTGRLDSFAPRAQVIHIDIDAAEVGKNRVPEVPVVADVKQALQALLAASSGDDSAGRTQAWLERIDTWKHHYPLVVPAPEGEIAPQEVMVALRDLAPEAYVTTDVGQHQMWAAQFLHNGPRHWISSGWPGHHGLRHARRHGRADRLPAGAGDLCGWRRQHPDEHPGARHDQPVRPAGEGGGDQQWLAGHGAPVAGELLRRALFLLRDDRRHAGLRRPGRVLRGSRRADQGARPAASAVAGSPGPSRPRLHRCAGAAKRELLSDGSPRRQQCPDGGSAQPSRTGHRYHPSVQRLRIQHLQRPPLLPQLRSQALTIAELLTRLVSFGLMMVTLLGVAVPVAAAADVLQVRSGTLLQVGDGNRNYEVELACIQVEPEQQQAAQAWLRQQLPRRTAVNLRPLGQQQGRLQARVRRIGSSDDLDAGLIAAGLAEPAAAAPEGCPV